MLMFIFAFKFTKKAILGNSELNNMSITTDEAVITSNSVQANFPRISESGKKFLIGLRKVLVLVLNYLLITTILFFCCHGFVTFAINSNRAHNNSSETHASSASASRGKSSDNEFKSIPSNKSRGTKVIPPDQLNTRFDDVAGMIEAKDEVQDIINFLQNPKAFGRLGANPPKGVLLYGEPGTGKTLLARAIAGESNVSFIAVSGSEFDEEYVGVGAARVRELFTTARENAPCIIFIDEIDALAHKRHPQDPSWSAQTVNQLLAEMDGLDNTKNEGIVLIGASNRLSAMDPAILRPGRLDRHIKLDVPTLSERADILNVYLKKVTLDPKVKAHTIAKMTPGFSGAELANLVNEATITATKLKKSAVDMDDFEVAKDRVILGSKREALKVTAKSRKITAYHEAGHALVGQLLGSEHNPLYKVTITPRGPSLGHTSFEPNDEDYSMSLNQIEARIATQLAGRLAEEIIFGEQNITTGAENDLQGATNLAYNMVTRWGYSKRIGLISNNAEGDFLQKDVIEQEVQAIIARNQERAKQILIQNRSKLEKLAQELLEHETLDGAQVKAILKSN